MCLHLHVTVINEQYIKPTDIWPVMKLHV